MSKAVGIYEAHSIVNRAAGRFMLERGARLGKYEIKEELGMGAMATVYKGKNVEDGSPVALKTPDRRLLCSVGALRQFSREGAALRALNHPNIVKVHSLGEKSGLPYIVMDYVDGHNLAQEIKSKHAFTIDEVVRTLGPIASALDYSHSRNIVHRDVKPGNIRIRRDGRPVLVDFGIVQTADGTVWDEGKTLGSVWYMAPEQVAGKHADGRTDQYSLAIVAYEMLVGKIPFEGDNIVAVAVLQRDEAPLIPARWSVPLATVMRKGLDKDPLKRFPSCVDFIAALDTAGKGQMPSLAIPAMLPQLPIARPTALRPVEPKALPVGRPAGMSGLNRAHKLRVRTFAVVIPVGIALLLMFSFARTPPRPSAAERPLPTQPTPWNRRAVESVGVRFLGGALEVASGHQWSDNPRFPITGTHAIEWECTLNYPPPPQSVSFSLQQELSLNGEGEDDDRTETIPVQLPSGSTTQLIAGTVRPPGGHWRPGLYRLTLQLDGAAIAVGSFRIYADVKPTPTNNQGYRIER